MIGPDEQPKGGSVTNYSIVTSASLNKKADDLELLALKATAPGHANIYRRVATVNRIAASMVRLTETGLPD